MPFIIIGIIIALVLIFGGKAIAKKAGALAKKIIKETLNKSTVEKANR